MSLEVEKYFLEFVLELEESIPEAEEVTEDEIDPDAIKRNARRYIRNPDEPRYRRDLHSPSFVSRVACLPSTERCVNPDCGGDSGHLQDLPHSGHVVCTFCGAVQNTQIIQELQPFFWAYNQAHRQEACDVGFDRSGSSYQPKFHWNEDEKLRSLTAPSIPVFNRRIIFNKLRAMGYTPEQDIINPKLIIQKACRLIDQEHEVHIYGRKWGEHWMSLVARFTNWRQYPPMQTEEEKVDFSNKFEWFCKAWPMCSHLLPGSRKDIERSQLPQFRWIFRQFLITFTPHQFDQWVRWLPVLSKNKEVELDLFWKRVCFVNGWEYIPVESFIRRIKENLKIKKRGRGGRGGRGARGIRSTRINKGKRG